MKETALSGAASPSNPRDSSLSAPAHARWAFVGFPQQPSISSQACPCWAPWSPRRRWGSPSPWWPPARSAGTSGSSPCTGRRSGRPSGISRQTSGWSRCRTPASARYRPPPRCSSPGKKTPLGSETTEERNLEDLPAVRTRSATTTCALWLSLECAMWLAGLEKTAYLREDVTKICTKEAFTLRRNYEPEVF